MRLILRNLIVQMLPHIKRKPVRVLWLKTLMCPIDSFLDDFYDRRKQIRLLINVNGQIGVLRGYLRARYHPDIDIVESYSELMYVGLKSEGVNSMLRVGLRSESIVLISIKGDKVKQTEIQVLIPIICDTELIAIDIERVRCANTVIKLIKT